MGGTSAASRANAALTAWSNPSVDVSSHNGQTIKLRFNFTSDPGAAFEGIYVDEIRLTNVAQPAACTPGACLAGPTFYGLVTAVDLDPQADTGVQLGWTSPCRH